MNTTFAPTHLIDNNLTSAPQNISSVSAAVSSSTLASTQAAVSLSVAAAALAGPGTASDIQAMVLVTLARCSAIDATAAAASAGSSRSGGYKLVTPFALSDTARGALGGNAVAFACLMLCQLLWCVYRKVIHKKSLMQAFSHARLPGFLILMGSTLHQSTLFCAIRLVGSDSEGTLDVVIGTAAILVSLVLPVAVVVAAAKVPRRFVKFELEPSSWFVKAPWKHIIPVGTILPRTTRRMLSSVFTSFIHPWPLLPAITFVSSFVSNIAAMLPADTPPWACRFAMYVSAAVHAFLAIGILVKGVHRAPSSRVGNALGLLLTGIYQAQIGSGFRDGVNAIIILQGALAIARTVIAVMIGELEKRMEKDPFTSLSKHPVWIIGDGGGVDDADNALRADSSKQSSPQSDLASASLPLVANDSLNVAPRAQDSYIDRGKRLLGNDDADDEGIMFSAPGPSCEMTTVSNHQAINHDDDDDVARSFLQPTDVVDSPFLHQGDVDDLRRCYGMIDPFHSPAASSVSAERKQRRTLDQHMKSSEENDDDLLL